MTNTTANKESDKLKDLVGLTNPKIDLIVREKLVVARVGLLLRASFFGNLATRLKLVNADEWCSTAATDGRNFYYNSRFIEMLRPKEIEFLFGHEVLHIVYDHFGRRGDRHPELWNIANDYCVNGDLVKHNIGTLITSVPCLYEQAYVDLSSEEVYDKLFKNVKTINIQELVNQIIDEHMDGNDQGQNGQGQNEGKKSGNGRPDPMSAEEREKLREEIRGAILSAASMSDAGSIPKGVEILIKDITESKIGWRDLLRQQLESTIKTDFSWMRPSRKGWDMDAILPGMTNDFMIDIVMALDASGSMVHAIKDLLGETQGIMDTFPAYRIHVFTFDTKVYNPQQYDSENLGNMSDYKIKGGGGTDFQCIFRYLKDNNINPHRLVVFTDGYPCGSWGDENFADTLWILHGTNTITPPWGQYAYYSEEKR